MLLSAFFFSLMALGVRILAERSPQISVIEIVFFRAFFSFLGLLFILKRARVAWIGQHTGLLLLRGLGGFIGMTSYYICLQELPLGAGVTIQQMNPLFAAIVSFLFLSETLSKKKVFFIFLAFFGVVLISQPPPIGEGQWQAYGTIMGVFSALVAGSVYTYARWLTRKEPILRIVAWFPLVAMTMTAILLFIPHPFQIPFVMPIGVEWGFLILIALGTLAGQIYLTEGLRLMNAATATTIGMVQVVLAVVYDVFLLSEMPNMIRILGIIVVTLSVIQTVRR